MLNASTVVFDQTFYTKIKQEKLFLDWNTILLADVGIATLMIPVRIGIITKILSILQVIETKYLVAKKLTVQQKNENKRLL